MKKMLVLIGLLLSAAVVLTACGGQAAPEAPAEPAAEEPAAVEEPAAAEEPAAVEEPAMPALVGDSLRGGLMWDKWWEVAGVDVPEGDMPLWATQSSNTRSGADTWRCKECHGWDYKGVDGVYGDNSHTTGFVGVYQLAGTDPNTILAAMQGATNADHDFSAYMTEQDLTDIALFVSEEVVDYSEIVGADKAPVGGDAADGQVVFEDNCIDCHGPEGLAINFHDEGEPEYYGTIASDNPWEFLAKVRFGQPGEADMPSLLDAGYTNAEFADLVAYAQTFPVTSPVTEGGRMYDKWWSATGQDVPEGDMPLWATQSSNERSGADTWRCKECHGWDYLGVDGAYGDSSHTTGFVGVYGATEMSAEEIVAWMDGTNNADHNFSDYLNEDQMNMFVAFLQNLPDVTMYINADKTVNGDAAHGQEVYTAACVRCHGEEGLDIMFGDESDPEFVGTIAADNPWEFFHKATNGQPAEHMPSGINLGFSLQDLADLAAYAQSLPTSK